MPRRVNRKGSPKGCLILNDLSRFSALELPDAGDENFHGTRFILDTYAEQCGLRLGVLAQFLHLVHHSAFRLVLFALDPALRLVPLFLLACLFFLAFSKS
jgi:hypothetical protein